MLGKTKRFTQGFAFSVIKMPVRREIGRAIIMLNNVIANVPAIKGKKPNSPLEVSILKKLAKSMQSGYQVLFVTSNIVLFP
jgi:hypothetical protein